jgi:formylglycine-generating enzyme required for sulfatase activity
LGESVEQEVDLGGGVTLTMVLIPPGEFMMGTDGVELARLQEPGGTHVGAYAQECLPHEIPQHCVKISQPFMLGRYEVTQAEWIAVMGSNPSTFQDNPNHPAENVSWDDLELFLNRLNEKYAPAHLKFVRPTEAQWEYAARAGITTLWPCGDTHDGLRDYAWFGSDDATHPVGQLRANAWGMYDVLGNVSEWCEDGYARNYYKNSPIVDPVEAPGSRQRRVRRGGHLNLPPIWSRYAIRISSLPSTKVKGVGFRLAAALLSR